MKYSEAKQILMKLAEGSYCTMSYESTMRNGCEHNQTSECNVRVASLNKVFSGKGSTWENALDKLRTQLVPIPSVIDESEEPNE